MRSGQTERRLRRAFRGIVALTVASPVVAFAACNTNDEIGVSTVDASSADFVDATELDAPEVGDAPDPCAPIDIDGAYIEGDAGVDGCATFRLLPCGVPADADIVRCLPSLDVCLDTCGPDLLFYCQLAPVTCTAEGGNFDDAAIIVECISCAGSGGRRPLGYEPPEIAKRTPMGDAFAAMAHLEAASVRAFRDLARWLAAFGAPRHLVGAARRAADDERRHASAMARLARRFGGGAAPVRVRRARRPSLVALLEDDARQGCVAETFGALLATWQSSSNDAEVASTMRDVAIDETRHAALAWKILAWGVPTLDAAGRVRVQDALEGAIHTLEERASAQWTPTCRTSNDLNSATKRKLAPALARTLRREAAKILSSRPVKSSWQRRSRPSDAKEACARRTPVRRARPTPAARRYRPTMPRVLEHVSNGAPAGARMSP